MTKEIIVNPDNELSPEYEQALSLHQKIIVTGRLAVESLVEMCKSLKEMRDTKLYTQLGYEEFEDYTETALNIKRRQAYTYIKNFETFGETQLSQNSHLGITKLNLLASLPALDRDGLIETGAADDLSVSELKKKIDELTVKVEQADLFEAENERLKDELQAEKENRAAEVEETEQADEMEINRLKNEIADLKAAATELSDVPPAELADEELAKIKEDLKKELSKEYKDKIAKKVESAKSESVSKITELTEKLESAESDSRRAKIAEAAALEKSQKLEKDLKLNASPEATKAALLLGQAKDTLTDFLNIVNQLEDEENAQRFLGGLEKLLKIIEAERFNIAGKF